MPQPQSVMSDNENSSFDPRMAHNNKVSGRNDAFSKEDPDLERHATHNLGDTNVVHDRVNSVGYAGVKVPPKGGKKLNAWQAAVIFVTNEIGIGVLSLPAALNVLGLFPGLLCIIVMGLLSLYSGYIFIQYWRKYPYLLNIVDYGRVLGGFWGELIIGSGFIFNIALICASAIITVSIGLNTISQHAMCTLGFTAITAVAMWALCIPQSMKFVSYCGWPCTISIVSAVLITMIALGVAGPDNPTIIAIGNPAFSQATSAFLNIAFAFAGNQAFPTILAEMEDPSRDFLRAIIIDKAFVITMYVVVAIVCYTLAGDQVVSPAIGSAPLVPAKVAYGVILVSLLGTGLVMGVTVNRYIHNSILRNRHVFGRLTLHKKSEDSDTEEEQPVSKTSNWALWIGVVTFFWLVVWIISGAIPIFDSLLNITAALLLAWFTWGIPTLLWFHLNWEDKKFMQGWKKMSIAALNVFILAIVLFMSTGGMYASVDNMLALFADPTYSISGVFTCENNAIAVAG